MLFKLKDYIALDNENSQEEKRLKMFHPVHTYISEFVKNFTVKELHQDIVVNGSIPYKEPTLKKIYGSTPKVVMTFVKTSIM